MASLLTELGSAETACVYPVFSGEDVGLASRLAQLLVVALAPEDLGGLTEDSGGAESSSSNLLARSCGRLPDDGLTANQAESSRNPEQVQSPTA